MDLREERRQALKDATLNLVLARVNILVMALAFGEKTWQIAPDGDVVWLDGKEIYPAATVEQIKELVVAWRKEIEQIVNETNGILEASK